MTGSLRSFIIVALCAACGCGGGGGGSSEQSATFIVQVNDEQFLVKIDQPEQVRTARLLLSGQLSHRIIVGDVVPGSGGYNRNPKTDLEWGWNLEPSSVQFSEYTIELCDGTPSYLDAHLDEWVSVVKTYCPWTGEVVAEVD